MAAAADAAAGAAPEAAEAAAKRQRTDGVAVPRGITAFNHVGDWFEVNKGSFAPPVCNKLMHKGQLSVMFVGGPNTRKDFHLEDGSEFFFQMRGDIELPTVQEGQRKLVKIRQGQVFCLPSRIPHSPQRPMPGSFGLVIERRRADSEMDGLVFYRDFEKCDKVLWERFFHCEDLAKDLPPVIKAFKEFEASDEAADTSKEWPETARPLRQDHGTKVPPPFFLEDFILAHTAQLEAGEVVPLFARDHPDGEFKVLVAGGGASQRSEAWDGDTWLYQHRGRATVKIGEGADSALELEEGCCCVVEPGTAYAIDRAAGSVGLVVQQDPLGNRPPAAAAAA